MSLRVEPVRVVIRHINERGQYAMNDDGWEWVIAFADAPEDWIKAVATKKEAVAWCRKVGYKIAKEKKS